MKGCWPFSCPLTHGIHTFLMRCVPRPSNSFWCLILTFNVDLTERNITPFPSLPRIRSQTPSFHFSKSVSAVVVIPNMLVFTFMGSVDSPLLTGCTTHCGGGLASIGRAVFRDTAYFLDRLGASHVLGLAVIMLWLGEGLWRKI